MRAPEAGTTACCAESRGAAARRRAVGAVLWLLGTSWAHTHDSVFVEGAYGLRYGLRNSVLPGIFSIYVYRVGKFVTVHTQKGGATPARPPPPLYMMSVLFLFCVLLSTFQHTLITFLSFFSTTKAQGVPDKHATHASLRLALTPSHTRARARAARIGCAAPAALSLSLSFSFLYTLSPTCDCTRVPRYTRRYKR